MQSIAVLGLKTGPSMVVRVVWYLVIGWWLTGLVMGLAWICAITIVGLPLAFYIVNRVRLC